MVELVRFDRRGFELIDDEFVSFIPIIVVKDDGVTKVHGMREIRNRENVSDLSSGMAINMLTEKDGRLLEVGGLTRHVTEVLQDAANIRSLMHRGSTTKDQVVSKKEGMYGGQSGPGVIPERLEL